MKYNIQKTVHLLPTPFDTAEIINSFLFYEIETITKKKKREIVKKFKNACVSSRLTNDEDEHWAICLDEIEIINILDDFEFDEEENNEYEEYDNYIFEGEVQFQADNCKKCGNYILSNSIVPENAVCYCH